MTIINMRTTKADKERLMAAAKASGVSLSAFLRSAAVTEARKVLGHRKPRLIVQHYEGTACGGPLDGCEIDSDGPSVPDGQGGIYNYVGGKWVWVRGLGTELHAALSSRL